MSCERLVALDIGTRSVIGLVLEKSDCYKVISTVVEEHNQRTMFDGQIHDIPMVAQIVATVIKKLEDQLEEKIADVAVAAAGRSLVTVNGRSKLEQELHQVEKDEITALEMQAVQSAQKFMPNEKGLNAEYYCVGYTVLNYYLDGSVIQNLKGQTGRVTEVEVIATFLPRVVIDSLITVLNQSNLKIRSLTLEPIAAAEIAIPDGMRQLNVALVDIGAGTSDIAITSSGKLNAYAMVPVAGDEITEKIAEHYLLDFSTAEKIKRSLHKKEVRFKDILGNVHTKMPTEEIIQAIDETVDFVAKKIAQAILELNSKPPQAVVCVGGGSLTPGIAKKIALALDLPATRVGVKGKDSFSHIKGTYKNVSAEQLITPIGIGLNSINKLGLTYCDIYVNDSLFRLLAIKNLTVADALISAGIDLRRLYGKPGKALTIEVNGEVTFLRGRPGTPAKIELNGDLVNVDAKISQGDRITFWPACNGEDCKASLQDVLSLRSYHVTINQKKVTIEPTALVNGQIISAKSLLEDNSIISIKPLKVKDVLKKTNHDYEGITNIKINGFEASEEAQVHNGDKLEFVFGTNQPSANNFVVIINGKEISLSWDKNIPPILSDFFTVADLDLNRHSKNKRLVMLVNDKEAGFTTEIKAYDKISLTWLDN